MPESINEEVIKSATATYYLSPMLAQGGIIELTDTTINFKPNILDQALQTNPIVIDLTEIIDIEYSTSFLTGKMLIVTKNAKYKFVTKDIKSWVDTLNDTKEKLKQKGLYFKKDKEKGEKLPLFCSNCNKPIDESFLYCPHCGVNLRPPSQLDEKKAILGNTVLYVEESSIHSIQKNNP